MTSGAHGSTEFSVREARHLVRDLFEPRPWIYWTDFLISIAIGNVCFALVRRIPLLSVTQILVFLISGMAFYRASLFTHELVHLKGARFNLFRVAWNLLCGIPFLMPSFMYYTHVAHHARKHYGTRLDGEYLPLASGPIRDILIYLCQPFVIPILAVVRFLLFAPLAWISPRFGLFVQERMSSMVMDPRYIRPLPSRRELKVWRLQEVACFLFSALVCWLLVRGRIPAVLLLQGYLTAACILSLNAVRTLGAHRFRHTGRELTFVEQLQDSLNYPHRAWLGELWAPVGLRFHALHHLFPSMPYHSLATAHARLMAHLPADSPYRQTVSPGLWHALAELWRASRAASRSTVRAPLGKGHWSGS